MIIIPGEIVALLTFPGIVVHEIAHRLMCDFFEIPVYEVTYFNIGYTRAGHVIHRATDNVMHNILIGLAPLFFNTVLCMIFTFPFSSLMYITQEAIPAFFPGILWWIGITIGANAFPSNQDVDNIVDSMEEETFGIWLLCSFVQLLNLLRRVWFDLLYAILISFILPCIIFG